MKCSLLYILICTALALPNAQANLTRVSLDETSLEQLSEKSQNNISLFNLSEIRITSGPFKKAIDYNHKYLLDLDPDKLLYGMRKGSGLQPKADNHYGGWDNWGSTAAGGYLSACALMYAATGDEQLLERVNYIVNEMAQCQASWGDGGLNVNDIEKLWFDKLKQGQLDITNVVPWYQVQFIMAGLRDAWLHCQNKQAYDTLVKLGDWCINVTRHLTDRQWQQMLNCEHGGPHEYLADLYDLTGDEKYLILAEKFVHKKVFDPLYAGDRSALYGLHANTQIPKFIGYQRISELDQQQHRMKRAANNFYSRVTRYLSWANGSNSQWECFFNEKEFPIKVDDNCGPETCNTFNMLKLTRSYYTAKPSVDYIDYYENALYNHLLPAIDPENGGFVYYTSMKPGHYRVFSTDYDSFWCCVVTGMQNPGRYGDMIYTHNDNDLYVNMFTPSTLNWQEKNRKVQQITDFPVSDTSEIKLTLNKSERFTIYLRCPEWTIADKVIVRLNGNDMHVKARSCSYIELDKIWHNNDEIEIKLPMHIWTKNLPGDSGYKAIFYGPIMLAAKIDNQGLTDSDFRGGGLNDQAAYINGLLSKVPILIGKTSDIEDGFNRISDNSLQFECSNIARPQAKEIIPFYDLHHDRYEIYWPCVPDEKQYNELRSKYDSLDDMTRKLNAAVDHITLGLDTREEYSHGLRGENIEIGGLPGMKWRAANNGGWLAYDMTVTPEKPAALVCRYWGSDRGSRQFDINIDNTKIASESLTAEILDEFIFRSYKIPASLTSGKTKVEVKFTAQPNNTIGGIFELWMLGD